MSHFLFQENKFLSDLTTFGIGGPARYFAEINHIEEMQHAIEACTQRQIPYFILGKGSNCLFDDRGYNGAILLNKINFFHRLSPFEFHLGAGYSFSLLGTQTARLGLSGLEFASGIPGSVGGAVYMNAGANGRETADSLVSVDFVDERGILHHLKKEELLFSYRTSSFQQRKGAIVGATFHLTPSSTARDKQFEIISYRKKTQPYREMSAGCVFRNPSCGSAGALIEKSGLKGISIGEAKVSEVHANFIVNLSKASSQDVLQLIALVKKQVQEKIGVDLESEIRYVPFEGTNE